MIGGKYLLSISEGLFASPYVDDMILIPIENYLFCSKIPIKNPTGRTEKIQTKTKYPIMTQETLIFCHPLS